MPHDPNPADAASILPDGAPKSTDDPQVDEASARGDYRFLRRMAIAAFVVASASAFTLNLVDPDLWGHVVYGQELLAERELPRTATHTFTAEGYRWINHENIAEIVFAFGFQHLGVKGMLVAKCLLGMTLLMLMHQAARGQGVRTLTAWAFFLLVASNLKAFFPMRPQLLSFLWCSVMLYLLNIAFRHWREARNQSAADPSPSGPACRVRWGWLAMVPLVMVVWVNSHGGFAAGLCILGALLAGRALEAILVDRHQSLTVVTGLTAVGLVSLAATLANPYGAGLVQWLAESLGSPRPEITEWAAPKMSDPVFWPFVTLALVNLLAWGATDRRRDWTQLAILSLVAWQSCMHLRHIAFFALLSGFWTTPHVASALRRLRNRAASGLPITQISPLMKWGATTALALSIVAQTVGLTDRLTKLPVARQMYPVDAFDFMSLHGLRGRMVVSFNWAQYALAAFPESTVSFDGRFRTCYPQEVVDMNFDFLLGEHWGRRHRSPNSGPIDGSVVLEHGKPELVVVDRKYEHAVGVMERESAAAESPWTLLYQDSVAQVWGRRSVFDDPTSGRYLGEEKRFITDKPRPFSVQWPAMPLQPVETADSVGSGTNDGVES